MFAYQSSDPVIYMQFQLKKETAPDYFTVSIGGWDYNSQSDAKAASAVRAAARKKVWRRSSIVLLRQHPS
jgi:hypothetical protein